MRRRSAAVAANQYSKQRMGPKAARGVTPDGPSAAAMDKRPG
ncbi:hypothetical protein [Nocardia sp. NPDC049149]